MPYFIMALGKGCTPTSAAIMELLGAVNRNLETETETETEIETETETETETKRGWGDKERFAVMGGREEYTIELAHT